MRISTLWTIGNTKRGRWLLTATLTASIWLALAGLAAAEPGDRSDERRDRTEVRGDRHERRGDWNDVRDFERLRDQLVAAEEKGDWQAERQARQRVYEAIRRELADSKRDAWADRSELRRDGSWNNEGDGRDRADANDRRDDRRDGMDSRHRLENEREIASELRTLQWDIRRGTPRALARESVLLTQFLRLERQDARASGRELREDRRDLREDSRDQGDWGNHRDQQNPPSQKDEDSRSHDPADDGEVF